MLEKTPSKTKTMGINAPCPINENHDFSDFDCGEDVLNEFVKTSAFNDFKNNESATYVLTMKDSNQVIAFYTLVHYHIRNKKIPDSFVNSSIKSKYNDIRIVLLGRLAVDKNYQRRGIGEACMAHALEVCNDLSKLLPYKGVGVHPKNENLVEYYANYGFQQINVMESLMILPIDVLQQLID